MAEFVFDLEWPDVPTHVEIAARRHLADTLACAVGAYREQPVRALRDYAVETRSRGGATLLGSSERTSPAMASLVNGTMVRYLDANDISSFGGGHFSDGIPPLLAVAEDRGHSAGDPGPIGHSSVRNPGCARPVFRLHAPRLPRPDANSVDRPDCRRPTHGWRQGGRRKRRRAFGRDRHDTQHMAQADRHDPLHQGRRRRTRRVSAPSSAPTSRCAAYRRPRTRWSSHLRRSPSWTAHRLISGPSKTSDRSGQRTATLSSHTRRRYTRRQRWRPL